VFGGQDVHNADAVVLYKSTPQNVQARGPAVSLYDPAAHAPHAPPSGPVCPTLQVQLVGAGAPLGECEFAGQEAHVLSAVRPTAAEYFPSPQSVHLTEPIAFL